MALRIICVNGSASRSMTVLSISVPSPSVSSRTDLPVASATSRTMRDMRWNTRFDRLRADRHHAFLNFARQLLEFIEADVTFEGAGEARLGDALRQHGLIDDEFADEIDRAGRRARNRRGWLRPLWFRPRRPVSRRTRAWLLAGSASPVKAGARTAMGAPTEAAAATAALIRRRGSVEALSTRAIRAATSLSAVLAGSPCGSASLTIRDRNRRRRIRRPRGRRPRFSAS